MALYDVKKTVQRHEMENR